jgi:hypothetical protein
MYESLKQRPLTRQTFAQRLLAHLGIALLLTAVSLAIGMVGYRALEHLSWIDAFLNAAMLLGQALFGSLRAVRRADVHHHHGAADRPAAAPADASLSLEREAVAPQPRPQR